MEKLSEFHSTIKLVKTNFKKYNKMIQSRHFNREQKVTLIRVIIGNSFLTLL